MKDWFDFFKQAVFYFNKWFYSGWFPVGLVIFMYLIYKFVEKSLMFVVIIGIIVLICWLFKLLHIPKNKSNKYGIVFLVNNSDAYDGKISEMFKKLKFILKDDFNIVVFNNNFLKNVNTSDKKHKLFTRNYQMIINMYALKGNENSESICSLTNEDVTFVTTCIDENILNQLNIDFKNSFKRIMKLSDKNSYTDVSENALLMSLSIRYCVSIIYIILGKLEQAEIELNKMFFEDLPSTDKNVQYLKKGIIRRYIDIGFMRMSILLHECEYLYNEEKLSILSREEEKLYKLLESSNDNVSEAKYYNNDIKSKLLFAKGNYYDAIACLNEMLKKTPSDYTIKLSKAFIKTYLKDFKGVRLYKEMSKRKDIDIEKIDDCIEFIDCALKNRNFDNTMLIVCKSILIYYWKDKKEGSELMSSVIDKIGDEDFKKNLMIRYLNNN